MNVIKRFKRRTEYRLHRTAIINDFNKKWIGRMSKYFNECRENGVMKVVRAKLVALEDK